MDNVFLLVAELERQNSFHGPNASQLPPSTSFGQGFGLGTPMSPSLRTRSFNLPSTYEQEPLIPENLIPEDRENQRQTHSHPQSHRTDADSDAPSHLGAEERVARTLAKIGPSLLMSTANQTVAFALGALVPMPAVRNFALYAALSVLVNATLQVTVFVSALTLDLRRIEASNLHSICNSPVDLLLLTWTSIRATA